MAGVACLSLITQSGPQPTETIQMHLLSANRADPQPRCAHECRQHRYGLISFLIARRSWPSLSSTPVFLFLSDFFWMGYPSFDVHMVISSQMPPRELSR